MTESIPIGSPRGRELVAQAFGKGKGKGKKKRRTGALSKAEATFEQQLRVELIGGWRREHVFDLHGRRWRFDFAWPALKFAVEIEGVTPEGGRHQRIEGFQKDLEKYESAMLDGWTVYRVSQRMVSSGHALATVRLMMERLPNVRG